MLPPFNLPYQNDLVISRVYLACLVIMAPQDKMDSRLVWFYSKAHIFIHPLSNRITIHIKNVNIRNKETN